MPEKLNIFSLKIHKGSGILKNPETFPNKDEIKNKNIKGGGSP